MRLSWSKSSVVLDTSGWIVASTTERRVAGLRSPMSAPQCTMRGRVEPEASITTLTPAERRWIRSVRGELVVIGDILVSILPG